MMYTVKEIYFTLQGEGYHTGRPAVFIRFTGGAISGPVWNGTAKVLSAIGVIQILWGQTVLTAVSYTHLTLPTKA